MQNVRKIITDPDSIRRAIREKTLEAVRAKFPVEGKQFSAQLENVTIKPITLSHGRQ